MVRLLRSARNDNLNLTRKQAVTVIASGAKQSHLYRRVEIRHFGNGWVKQIPTMINVNHQ
jgi:hypothetical protein